MTFSTTKKWSIDTNNSHVSFVVNHLMISAVKGTFKNFNATVFTEGKDFTSAKIDFWLDPSSIDTNDKMRDKHLISSEFFDTDKFPFITFVSDSFKKTNSGNYELHGNLMIKEITKHVKLNAKFSGFSKNNTGCDVAKFLLTGTLNRKHWKLDWNVDVHAGSILVSDDVLIQCEILLQKENNELTKDTLFLQELEQSTAPAYANHF